MQKNIERDSRGFENGQKQAGMGKNQFDESLKFLKKQKDKVILFTLLANLVIIYEDILQEETK